MGASGRRAQRRTWSDALANPRPKPRIVEMKRVDAEHFAIDLPVGTDYLLSVDGGELPPRSAEQVPAIRSPRTVPGGRPDFDWTDADWLGIDPLGEGVTNCTWERSPKPEP